MTLLVSINELDQVYANLREGNKNIVCINGVINRSKPLSATRASDTFAGFNDKKCTVVGALDHATAVIEELVFNPFERNTEMWTVIAIQIDSARLLDCEKLALCNLKAFTTAFRNIGKGTETQFI